MLEHEEVHEHEHEYVEGTYPREGWSRPWRRISWAAIIAGTLVTLAIFVTLQILGAGIGASTIDLAEGETPSAQAFGIGAAVWWFIIGLISLFIGGWVAGRLGWLPNKLDRVLHGLTVWALFYAVMLWLVTTTLSNVVGGGLSMLGQGVAAAGQAATSPQVQETIQQTLQTRGLTPDAIGQEIGPGTGQQDPRATKELASAVGDYLRGSKTPQERQQVVQRVAQVTGKSETEADRVVANLENKARQIAETGEQAVKVTAGTLIGLAISMLLGAVAAALGGLLATEPEDVYPRGRRRTVEAETHVGTYASR